MQVRYDEGTANHIAPEPCITVREGRVEASAGERIGQPLSRESDLNLGADAVVSAEGNTEGGASASPLTAQRGRRPWHVRTLPAREPGDLLADHRQSPSGPHREGEEL